MQAADPAALHTANFPRAPLMALAALALATVLAVAAVRWLGIDIHSADAPTVASRLLRFEDTATGGVRVVDARSGAVLQEMQGEQGFLRGALRALARERRMRELGAAAPFELSARADGRLTLRDTATGGRLDLEAFGPTNAAVFGRLLALDAAAPHTKP